MKTVLAILITLLTLNSTTFFSQDYDPVIKDGSFWDVANSESIGPCNYNLRRYQIDSDTIIKNKTYKKIKIYPIQGEESFHELCLAPPLSVNNNIYTYSTEFIREDLNEKKLYLYTNKIENEYKEYLICDFNLEIGDIIKDYPIDYGSLQDIELEYIHVYNGKKQYQFNYGTIEYTEGIGPYGGILHPYAKVLDVDTFFYCYGNTQNQNSCVAVLSTNEISPNNSTTFYPNPVENILTLEGSPLNSTVKIYSMQGKLVKQINIEKSNTTIDLSNLTKGIYFIKFSHTALKTNKTLKILKL